jgi:cysteine desulfurase
MAQVRSIYLDHSATTPTDPRVVEAMLPYFGEVYGNASSSHRFGRKAESVIEAARETVAHILNCRSSEIVFTSGGSESDNLALRGAAWFMRHHANRRHVISAPTEHEAVGRTLKQLDQVMGFDCTLLPVDPYGNCMVDDFEHACRDETCLATLMYANNEVGTIQPIAELAAAAHRRGILFHTDAVQAGGQLSVDVQALGVDMMSLSAHKFYGPKGVGVLFVRDGIELMPAQTGGSHENARRAGTLNTPLIVGLAKALEIAETEREAHTAHFRNLRDLLIEGILAAVPQARLTGHPDNRLPSHASFVFEGVESTRLLMHLDVNGIAASSGSACKTGNPEPSEVLRAMGYTEQQAMGGVRFTVGRQNTVKDIEYTVDAVAKSIEKLQRLQVV